MPHFLEVFGRLHPLLVHLPIGLVLGAALLEVLAARGRFARGSLGPYLWIAALGAVASASAGWVLSHEEGYGGPTIERHEQLGIAVAVCAVLAALLHDSRAAVAGASRARRALYRVALAAGCILLVPAGHLGSTLTHGDDWLAGPRRAPRPEPASTERGPEPAEPGSEELAQAPGAEEPAGDGGAASDHYATRVAPILAARCATCHGAKKRKGALRLDTADGIRAGGENGPVIAPGDPAASELLRRVRLPLEHEDHMPPEGKPQPTPEELDEIEAWIAAGAAFGAAGELPGTVPASAPEEEYAAGEAPPEEEPEQSALDAQRPPVAALDALDRVFVHHAPRAPGSAELLIDVAAVAREFGDDDVQVLLVPLAAWIGELGLARSAITDAALVEIARFPRLARLDLRSTGVSDAGLAALAGHAALEELVLARTALTDASVDVLAGLPRLRALTVWSAGLTPEGIARLRAARTELVVNAGDEPPAEALEAEGELTFTSERPLPGAEAVPEALRPVNETCPVSGSPVNPKYSILHGARVVGFCCPNCPKEFWADPAKFESKLP